MLGLSSCQPNEALLCSIDSIPVPYSPWVLIKGSSVGLYMECLRFLAKPYVEKVASTEGMMKLSRGLEVGLQRGPRNILQR